MVQKQKICSNVAAIRSFGETIDFTVDWKTGYLGDAIVDVSKMYGVTTTAPLGWNVYITDDFSAFEMDVWYGRNKHINQTVLRLLFSVKNLATSRMLPMNIQLKNGAMFHI